MFCVVVFVDVYRGMFVCYGLNGVFGDVQCEECVGCFEFFIEVDGVIVV